MDIVKDLTKFEPETDPMPANGKVGIGYSMPSVVHGNVGIESVKHWVLSLPSYQFGICTKRFCTRYQTYLWICVGISTQCQPSHQIVTSSVSISHRISHAYMIFCHLRILFDVKKKPYFIFHSQFVIVLKILMGLAYIKHQRKYYLLRWFLSQFHLV